MNIKFAYLYRDASNYKQYNEVVFTNPNELPLEQIQRIITSNLIDGSWFIAKDWGLPDMHFKEYDWDDEIDHNWHEFSSIEETSDTSTGQQTIGDFIERIKGRNQSKKLRFSYILLKLSRINFIYFLY